MLTRYENAVPIYTRPRSVWRVIFPDGKQQLEVWSEGAAIMDVVRHLAVVHREFVVQRVDVGSFVLVPSETSMYSGDARFVNQDGEVV